MADSMKSIDIHDIRKIAPTLGIDIKSIESEARQKIVNDQIMETISSVITSNLVSNLQNFRENVKKKLKYYMPDVNDFDRLQNRFRQFRLEMDAMDVLNHDHAYQANSRILENIVLDNMLEYDCNLVSSSTTHDFVYGEVGADPKQIIKDKKFNVHCCCPIISIQDTARKTKSDLF